MSTSDEIKLINAGSSSDDGLGTVKTHDHPVFIVSMIIGITVIYLNMLRKGTSLKKM